MAELSIFTKKALKIDNIYVLKYWRLAMLYLRFTKIMINGSAIKDTHKLNLKKRTVNPDAVKLFGSWVFLLTEIQKVQNKPVTVPHCYRDSDVSPVLIKHTEVWQIQWHCNIINILLKQWWHVQVHSEFHNLILGKGQIHRN